MDDIDLSPFEKEFDLCDPEQKGEIGIDDFWKLYRNMEKNPDLSKENAEVIMRGLDVENRGAVTREQFLELVKGVKKDDRMYLAKLIFRSFDHERMNSLGPDEIVEYTTFCGMPFTKEQATRIVYKNLTTRLNFAQLYKILTSQSIDPNTDPYDGKLDLNNQTGENGENSSDPSSRCCLLI